MKQRSNLLKLILILLVAILLFGCQKKDFDYVNTTVLTPAVTVPWANSGAFTYTPSEDGVGNVINWAYLSGASDIFPSGNDLYFYGHFQASRYDPETGRQTFLCTDPVCDHISDCPLYLMQDNFQISGDKVVFYQTSQADGESVTEVMVYSMTDRTKKALRTIEGNGYVASMVAVEDSYFFYDWVQDEETNRHTYSLCRQYYDSGKIEVLDTGDSLAAIQSVVGADGEQIYLYDYAASALIACSLKDMTELSRVEISSESVALCKAGYLIYLVEGELFRINLDGSDRKSLEIRDVDSFYLTDSYLYYQKIEGKRTGIQHDAHYGDIETEAKLQTVYRADHNGKNAEVVWKNENGNTIIEIDSLVVQGNYIYSSFSYYQFDGDSVTVEGSQTMGNGRSPFYCRIDCTTGEIYYIEMEKLSFSQPTF